MWFRVGRRSRRTFSTDFDICDFCRQRVGIFSHIFIRPPCVADTDIIFLPCGFFYLSSSFLHTATINYDAVETSSKNLKVSRKSSTQSTSDSNFTHIVSFISFGIAVNTSWHTFADLRSFGDENYENPLTAAVQRGWMLLWVEWLSCCCCWRWCKVQMNRAVCVCIPRRLRQCGASHVYDIKLYVVYLRVIEQSSSSWSCDGTALIVYSHSTSLGRHHLPSSSHRINYMQIKNKSTDWHKCRCLGREFDDGWRWDRR